MRSQKTNWEVLSGVLVGILGLLVTGCAPTVEATPLPTPPQEIAAATLTIPPPPTPTETVTTVPSQTLTDTQPTPTLTLVPGHIYISPLNGVPIEQLGEMVSNKFSPPRLGSDDPHQGVDFSVVDQASGIALSGNPVQAVLGGGSQV